MTRTPQKHVKIDDATTKDDAKASNTDTLLRTFLQGLIRHLPTKSIQDIQTLSSSNVKKRKQDGDKTLRWILHQSLEALPVDSPIRILVSEHYTQSVHIFEEEICAWKREATQDSNVGEENPFVDFSKKDSDYKQHVSNCTKYVTPLELIQLHSNKTNTMDNTQISTTRTSTNHSCETDQKKKREATQDHTDIAHEIIQPLPNTCKMEGTTLHVFHAFQSAFRSRMFLNQPLHLGTFVELYLQQYKQSTFIKHFVDIFSSSSSLPQLNEVDNSNELSLLHNFLTMVLLAWNDLMIHRTFSHNINDELSTFHVNMGILLGFYIASSLYYPHEFLTMAQTKHAQGSKTDPQSNSLATVVGPKVACTLRLYVSIFHEKTVFPRLLFAVVTTLMDIFHLSDSNQDTNPRSTVKSKKKDSVVQQSVHILVTSISNYIDKNEIPSDMILSRTLDTDRAKKLMRWLYFWCAGKVHEQSIRTSTTTGGDNHDLDINCTKEDKDEDINSQPLFMIDTDILSYQEFNKEENNGDGTTDYSESSTSMDPITVLAKTSTMVNLETVPEETILEVKDLDEPKRIHTAEKARRRRKDPVLLDRNDKTSDIDSIENNDISVSSIKDQGSVGTPLRRSKRRLMSESSNDSVGNDVTQKTATETPVRRSSRRK